MINLLATGRQMRWDSKYWLQNGVSKIIISFMGNFFQLDGGMRAVRELPEKEERK
jgi:hypothetical protein